MVRIVFVGVIPVKLTLSRLQRTNNDTPGGAYCGVAIIIVVDVHMDLGDGGGGGRDMNSKAA